MNKSCVERLILLSFSSLEKTRLYGNMMQVVKTFNRFDDISRFKFYTLIANVTTASDGVPTKMTFSTTDVCRK